MELLSFVFASLYQFGDAFAFLVLAACGLAVIFGMMGVINLDHHQVNGFLEEDLEMLTAFGHVVGVALRNANVLRDWTRELE